MRCILINPQLAPTGIQCTFDRLRPSGDFRCADGGVHIGNSPEYGDPSLMYSKKRVVLNDVSIMTSEYNYPRYPLTESGAYPAKVKAWLLGSAFTLFYKRHDDKVVFSVLGNCEPVNVLRVRLSNLCLLVKSIAFDVDVIMGWHYTDCLAKWLGDT